VATYYDIFGQKVQYLSSDPANVTEGQVWYNSTSNTAKVQSYQSSSVASAGNVNTARTQLGGTGTLTAGLIYGGEAPALTGATEEFDGSTWTTGGTCPAQKSDMHSSGTQTAALWGGGSPLSSGSFEYDGSTWTSGGSMTFSGRDFYSGGTGILTAAIQIGGFINPGNYSTTMQYYDGSTWTNIPQTYPSGPQTNQIATTGTQTACISAGGSSGANELNSNEWNGSTWTATNNLASGINSSVANGTVAASNLISGHAPSVTYSTLIQTWDGTCWATSPLSLSTGRSQSAGGGSATSAYVATGANGTPTYTNTTEIFNAEGPVLQTISTS